MLKRVTTFILIILFTIVLFMAQGTNGGVWAVENYDIAVDSYESFSNSIQEAMLNFDDKISIKIDDYDENVYNLSQVIDESIEKNPEIYYHYGGELISIRSHNSNQPYRVIDIDFRYRGTQRELDDLVEIKNYDEYKQGIADTLKAFDNKMLMKIHNYDEKKYNLEDAIYKVLSEVPDLDYGINGWSLAVYGSGEDKIIEADIYYSFTKEEMVEMKEAVNKKAEEILAKLITSEMKDYEKALIIHDYIVSNAEYNMTYYEENSVPEDEHTAYGVLIKGTGVCSSYAKAMHKLLDMVGIEAYFVRGNAGGEPHAWNIAKIQEGYYHLDLTWDDPIMSYGSDILSHDYFNLSDSIISKDHSWNREEYPKCTSIMYSYENIRKILSGEISLITEGNVIFKTIEQLPNNTVVIGYNAFDIDFANNSQNKDIIRNSFNQGKNTNIYVKYGDAWFNADGSDAEITEIPDVSYTLDGHYYENYLSSRVDLAEVDDINIDIEKLTVGVNISVSIDVKGEVDYPEVVGYKIAEYEKVVQLGEKIFVFPGKKAGDVIEVLLFNKKQELVTIKNILLTEDISKPNNLEATAISENSIQLYWEKVDEADYYYVYKGASIDGPFEPYYDYNGKKDKYYWYSDFCMEVYDIDPNTTLYFKISAVKDGVESQFSNIVSATTFDHVGSRSLYMVKNGSIYDNQQFSIGEAFDVYFINPQWTYFESVEGDHVVEFTGQCYYNNELTEILVQLTVNLEEEDFYVNYKEKNGVYMTDSIWIELLNEIFKK